MAKRFTDTEIWDKEWFMKLSPRLKCLVRYIFDKCDAAGLWSPNWTLASAYIGEPVCLQDIAEFESQVEFIGHRIFIVDFIAFQYGTLSEKCKPHIKIIALLKKYGLFERVCKGYTYPLERVEEEDKDKEEEEDKEKHKDRGMGKGIAVNMVQVFKTHFPDYPVDQKLDFTACLEIAYKIADSKGWPKESVVNGKMQSVTDEWEKLIVFARGDKWYCTRAISDLNKEFQRLSQSAKNGTTHQRSAKAGPSNGIDPTVIERTGFGEL